ncbi:MAG TPA: hypothetical protein VL327_04765 [Pyrinomonadaceae bacterium]|jgi:hypothetical protein|nr:hypothetical protein [Pyrinomonadaceae bacterium]
MIIAKIVSSNSHIDYVGRVVDDLDVDSPPQQDDYGFAQFVQLAAGPEEIVGVIYDSKLINPEYANFGPRLSPSPQLKKFSPDFLNEQGILIGILLLGTVDENSKAVHGVPRRIIPAGSFVKKIGTADAKRFHLDGDGSIQIHYYSQVIAHAGLLAVPLLESIIDQLSADCSPTDGQRLSVLKQSLQWQRTMGGMRL